MEFDDADLFEQLLALDAAGADEAPFGIVGLDAEHHVVLYNRPESQLSGLSPDRVLGRHFFSDVAPCTNNFMVAQRFETEDELDDVVDYVFTLRMRPTPVRLRLLRRPDVDQQFLVVQPV